MALCDTHATHMKRDGLVVSRASRSPSERSPGWPSIRTFTMIPTPLAHWTSLSFPTFGLSGGVGKPATVGTRRFETYGKSSFPSPPATASARTLARFPALIRTSTHTPP